MTNIPHIIETALLLLVAYLVGCILGYTLRRLTARPILLQGEAVQPATVVAQPSPAQTPAVPLPLTAPRELSAAVRLAMASPLEPTDPPVDLAPNTQTAPVTAPPSEHNAATTLPLVVPVTPMPPVVEAAEQLAVPMPKTAPQPIADAPKFVERVAPVRVAKPRSRKAAANADHLEPLSPATVAAATPTTARAPVKPDTKPPVKSTPKKSTDPKPVGLSAPRDGRADDLKQIKGIGPKIEHTLNDLGIFHVDQLAKLSKANVAWLDDHLGFKGRVTREAWIAQAKALSKPKQ